MKKVLNYVFTAFRIIRSRPLYSLINIIGLSLGMSCCIVILLWVHNELSYDKFHKNEENLYRLTATYDDNVWINTPWAVKTLLVDNYPEITSACWFKSRPMIFGFENKQSQGSLGMVSQEFLEMFSFPLETGNGQMALADRNSVIISREKANELFDDSDPLGNIIRFENGSELMVTGILADFEGKTHMKFDMLARPDLFYGDERLSSWIVDCSTYIELNEFEILS